MPNVHPLIIFNFFAKTLLDINSLFLREAEAKEYEDEDEYVEYSDEDEEGSDEDEDEEEYDEEGEEEEFEDDEEYDSEEFEDDAEGLSFRGKLERMVLIKLNPILPVNDDRLGNPYPRDVEGRVLLPSQISHPSLYRRRTS